MILVVVRVALLSHAPAMGIVIRSTRAVGVDTAVAGSCPGLAYRRRVARIKTGFPLPNSKHHNFITRYHQLLTAILLSPLILLSETIRLKLANALCSPFSITCIQT